DTSGSTVLTEPALLTRDATPYLTFSSSGPGSFTPSYLRKSPSHNDFPSSALSSFGVRDSGADRSRQRKMAVVMDRDASSATFGAEGSNPKGLRD
ncbi:hypothetical protein BaRGS_00030470, partial [Batillaria attramentaria]